MSRRSHNIWGVAPAPRAPRINPCPLPDIGSPLMALPIPIAKSPPQMTSRPSTTHRHRHHGSTDERGYSSSIESSKTPRPTSQAVRTPVVSTSPLKGILKTGNSESSVVFRASLIQQDRDGYTSSPEKGTSLKPSQGSHDRLIKSKPSHVSKTTNPSIPPATLHWKLLPFDAKRSKGQLKFDFGREVDEIVLAEIQRGSRPLSVLERNKSAAEPGLTEMVIHCVELPDWPVHVARQSGIRCVDVFEAIRDTYNVVLTSTERTIHQSRVRDIERRRPPTPEGAKKGVRRRDLLDGKTLFLGLDWRTSDSRYPNGCWCLKVGSSSL
ncbi:hypothetical protein F5148DRAFT_727235 [Russula earlei]|uniref:Uncharacterized protein n=1 Tax=Russula earlei TaxID=71964 RepID=A0ACC0TTF7_9AGAM|nr:hypothetical protein F5148DRAFT_727235 [Russula earlei]